MRLIYRLVCFQTGLVYVGQTFIKYEKSRLGAHFSALKHEKHCSQRMQADYNLYGQQSFFYEVLERDVPVNDGDMREKYWIAHFDSFHNGYNGSPGLGITCTWNGVEYSSMRQAAWANGYTESRMQAMFKRGYTSDTDLIRGTNASL